MLFKYKAADQDGIIKEGQIDAPNRDMAISGLQRRSLVVISIKDDTGRKSILSLTFFEKVSMKDIVILSRQIATLFDAQVSALKAFSMLASNSDNKLLSRKLIQIGDDLQGGISISGALSRHPEIFSNFYINMVKVGEETGKLNQVFLHLAEYLDRQYSLTSKTRNALIYPVFVIFTFFVVMGLMFVVVLGVWFWRLSSTVRGKTYLDKTRLEIPLIGNLYKKLYLSRISDNLDTMLSSGVPIVRSIDITSEVVGSRVYRDVLRDASDSVKSGLALSAAFERHGEQIPGIMVQMVKVGEETGSLGNILKNLTEFYKREVDDAIDTLVGLIEPFMIVVLGLGVGLLLVSVLMPIYNLAGGIG